MLTFCKTTFGEIVQFIKGFRKKSKKWSKQQLLNSILLGESQTTLIFKGDRDHTLQE
jgi:hypothetical protein